MEAERGSQGQKSPDRDLRETDRQTDRDRESSERYLRGRERQTDRQTQKKRGD